MQNIIIQLVLFQLLFLVAYDLLFRKETFFNWNRGYLLITSLVSIILPFIKLDFFSKVMPTDFFVNLPAVIIGEENKTVPVATQSLPSSMVTTNSFNIDYTTIWGIGALVFTIILCNKLYRLWKYKHNNSIENREEYSLITIANSTDAFSFLRTIFLGDSIEKVHKESILTHEKVHVKEKHTLDLLWFEVLRIVMWFNPLVYLYQKRITEVHEFIADKSASKHQQNYYENLLAKTFNIAQFSVVNQFYSSSLIKKRIIMLTKEQSQKRKLVKYLTVVPIVLAMLVYVSCNDTLETANTTENNIIEEVSKIIYNSLPHDIDADDITEKQLELIRIKIANYIALNPDKEFTNETIMKQPHYKGMLEGSKISNNEAFIYIEMMISILIENVKNEQKIFKSAAVLFTNSNVFYNLEKLDYKFIDENTTGLKPWRENTQISQTEVPFSKVDQAPIFLGSEESNTETSSKKTFTEAIAKHINDNFNRDIAKTANLVGKQRIAIGFKVDKKGEIKEVKARTPHIVLKNEAIRVIKKLPKMKPAIHNNEKVGMIFSIPVIFNVE
jgi:beta-lactamase regulating signal transducer with metallopeptidase domain